MLSKKNRLTHRKNFGKIFKKGQGNFSNIVGIKLMPNNLTDSRFGIIVSNKISKKAVERNKIRRQIREIIRLNLDKIKKGFDIAIICLPEIKKKKYKEIEKEILKIFKKMNVMEK